MAVGDRIVSELLRDSIARNGGVGLFYIGQRVPSRAMMSFVDSWSQAAVYFGRKDVDVIY